MTRSATEPTGRAEFGGNCSERRTRGIPALYEGVFEFGNGRSAQFNTRVAPWWDVARRPAQPFGTDAHAGQGSVGTIDDQKFAVIAADPTEWLSKPRRIEHPYLTTRGAQRRPKGAA